MKKAILILGAAIVLAGCNQEQGGSSDSYTTGSGSSNAPISRNAPSLDTNSPSATSTNQTPRSTP